MAEEIETQVTPTPSSTESSAAPAPDATALPAAPTESSAADPNAITGLPPAVDQAASTLQPQTEQQPAAAPQPKMFGQEKADAMVATGQIAEEDATQIAALTPQEAAQFTGVLESNGLNKDEISSFLKKTPEQRQEQYQVIALTEQLLNEGIFTEEYRDQLLEQSAEELTMYYDQLQPEDNQEIAPENRVFAQEIMKWTGKGGTIDEAYSAMEKLAMLEEEDGKLDALVDEQWKAKGQDLEEIKRLKLEGVPADQLEEAFRKAYKAEKLSDPTYIQARDAQIDAEVTRQADMLRKLVRDGIPEELNPDGTPKDMDPETAEAVEIQKTFWDRIKKDAGKYMAIIGVEAVKQLGMMADQALNNDFGSFLRAILTAGGGGFSRDRFASGRYDAHGSKVIGMETFEGIAKKPGELGKALSDAYQKTEFIEAGFHEPSEEDLKAAKNGEPEAVRKLMKQFLNELFDSSALGDKLDKRWEIAQTVLPEAIYPGQKVSFDDKMRLDLKEMHSKMKSNGGVLDSKIFGAEVSAGNGNAETTGEPTAQDSKSDQVPAAA